MLFIVLPSILIGQKIVGIPQDNPSCYKSKTLYTVIDNTKTRFNWTMEMEVFFTDGSSTIITQTPTTGWTAQLNQWVGLFDAAISNKCDDYLVEPRCNVLPSGCGGLLPPPSELQGLIPNMAWRYLNIGACSTCPAINNVEIVSINGVDLEKSRPLVMSYVEGEEKRYTYCESCGTDGTLYYFGTDEVVPESDMPLCIFSCGESFPTLPEPICAFISNEEGCDDGTDPPTPITRICDICEGQIVCNYYVNDADGALVDYNNGEGLIGSYIDCESGEPVGEPVVEKDSVAVCNFPSTPFGEFRCYGSDDVAESSYQNTDNATDISFSIGGTPQSTQMKWAFNQQGPNDDGNQDFTQDIVDCIDSGEIAYLTLTDVSGNVVTYDAYSYTGTIGSNGLFFDAGLGSSGLSGKLSSATLVCGDGAQGGFAYFCTDCGESGNWYDTKTGDLVDESILSDCVSDADCPVEVVSGVGCLTENVDGVGVQDDPVLFFIERDCNGVVSTSNYTTPDGTDVDAQFVSTDCSNDVQLQEVSECVIDGENRQWIRYAIFINGVLDSEFYVLQSDLSVTSNDIGAYKPCPNNVDVASSYMVCDSEGNVFDRCKFIDGSIGFQDLLGNSVSNNIFTSESVCTGSGNILDPNLSCIDIDGNGNGTGKVNVPNDWPTYTDLQKIDWVLGQYGMDVFNYNTSLPLPICVPTGDQVEMFFNINNCNGNATAQLWTVGEKQQFTDTFYEGELGPCCCNEGGALTVVTNDVGVGMAWATVFENGTFVGENIASVTPINGNTDQDRYQVTFINPMPDNNYIITDSKPSDEPNGDERKGQWIDSSKNVNGFEYHLTADDNGGTEDPQVFHGFDFVVTRKITVVTDVISN